MNYDLMLFDLDEVLVDYDETARLELLAERSGITPGRVHQALTLSGFEDESDRGDWPPELYADELSRRLGATVSLQDCIDARAASMKPRPHMLELAQAVSAQVRVAILTNNGTYMHGRMREICPALFPLFDGAVHFAAEYSAVKPDPRSFLDCLAERGVTAQRTLFVDDRAPNIEGARSAGLDALHFTDAATLARELIGRGLFV